MDEGPRRPEIAARRGRERRHRASETSEGEWHGTASTPAIRRTPLASRVRRQVDRSGHLLSETNELGYVTKYNYDFKGRILSEEFPGGLTIGYVYDNSGLPIQVKAKDGTISRYEWDNQLRLSAIVNSDGTRTEWTYKGSLRTPFSTSRVANDGSEKYTLGYAYDPQMRLTRLFYPDGTFEGWKYGCCDVVEAKDRANAITKYAYDAGLRKVLEVSPNDEKTSYVYDFRGRLLTKIFPDMTEESVSYNDKDKITRKSFRDGKSVTYQYDAVGHKVSEAWSDRSISETKYDRMARVVSVSGTHENNIEYAYDALGRIVSEKNFGLPKGNVARVVVYEYNVAGKIAKVSNLDGLTIVRNYDATTGRVILTCKNGVATIFEYDSAGNKTKICKAPASNLSRRQIVEIRTYDKFGNLKDIRNAKNFITASYIYRPDGLLESISHPVSDSGSVFESHVYSYNPDGTQEHTIYRKFVSPPSVVSIPNLTASTGMVENTKNLGYMVSKSVEKGKRLLWQEDALGNRTPN